MAGTHMWWRVCRVVHHFVGLKRSTTALRAQLSMNMLLLLCWCHLAASSIVVLYVALDLSAWQSTGNIQMKLVAEIAKQPSTLLSVVIHWQSQNLCSKTELIDFLPNSMSPRAMS